MTNLVCWLCGSSADSSEHRLKRTDLIRAYGRGPYRGSAAPLHVRDQQQRPVQGPSSARLKYSPSLCQACNTTRTQAADRAYEQFTDWVIRNESHVLSRRFVDFAEVFGEAWPDRQLQLYRYFAKSFGCRLVDAGQQVPPDVIDLFSKPLFRTALWLSFAVNEDILLLSETDRLGFIGKSELIAWLDAADRKTVNGYEWNEHVSWLTAFYSYGAPLPGNLGSSWVADSQYVYLGCFSPLPAGERTQFIARLGGTG